MTSILQLSDLHLFADKSALLKGINPWESLQRVLNAVHSSGTELDHVVLSGDLTHDGLPQTYEHLDEALCPWAGRVWAIPGNHDDRSLVERNSFRSGSPVERKSFRSGSLVGPHSFRSSKGAASQCAGGNRMNSVLPGRVTFTFAAGHWRIIGLDTLVPQELYGRLGDEQLAWLEVQLAQHRAMPTLIFMHHPPVTVDSVWLDRIGLTDREAFCRLVESSPQVKLICCGHIHQEFEARLGAATVLATPSTSVQFQPGTDTLVVDDLPPGYRILRLEDGRFETEVVRVDA